MKRGKLLKEEIFGNSILRWYSNGDLTQTFPDGVTWVLS